jgi:glycosyltransferase involved in cell wall biosynthesis
VPAPGGNGLAMRAGLQLRALSASYDVDLVVVPVAGGSREAGWAGEHAATVAVVQPDDSTELRGGIVELLKDPLWRERLRRAEPMPTLARAASPALARAVLDAAGTRAQTPVHALRAYLAPLALAVAERLRAPWTTLDLDDDDERLLGELGRRDEARGYGRLLHVFGPSFAWLSLASGEEAEAIAGRHGLRTTVVPNGVPLPPGGIGRSRRDPSVVRLLLVGNLTYEPNVAAAGTLVRDVLPRVRDRLGRDVRVELVGPFEPGSAVAALRRRRGVELTGWVDDLAGPYARADVVVAPLAHGAGTRIKLLEALAYGVPVVTSPAGAAGLGAGDGVHLLLADGPGRTAEAVARIVLDEGFAAALAAAGRALVESRFDAEVVARQLRALMPG